MAVLCYFTDFPLLYWGCWVFSIVRNALMFIRVLTSLQIIISLLYILKDGFCVKGTHFTFRYIVPDRLPERS